jgi:hypothetical protein
LKLTAAEARRILKEEEGNLLSRPGVVSVSLGEDSGHPFILILVESKDALAGLPREVRGVPIKIQVGGKFRPQ